MRVTNETNYQTSQLRKLALFIAKRERLLTDIGRGNLRIKFVDRGTRAWRGSTVNPGSVQVGVLSEGGVLVKEELARAIAWAIGVSVGLKNKDMNGLSKYWPGQDSIDYYSLVVDAFPIAVKPPVAKPVKAAPSIELKRKRLQVQAIVYKNKLAQWERQLDRSMAKIKEYRKRWAMAEKALLELNVQVLETVEDAKPGIGRKFRAVN